jgi:Ca2+-transporting ATPase
VALAGERMTPLEGQVEGLGRRLIGLAVAVCGVVGLAGILHGEPIGLMLETAISLAVAAIPEGLPAVTAVALAAGMWRLARAGALVRRLPAVETLGSTTVICADKTGTMTVNRMTVTHLYVEGRTIEVDGNEHSAAGAFREGGMPLDPRADADLTRLFTVAALANNASVEASPDGPVLHGDPTETAVLAVALKAGSIPARSRERGRVGERFRSTRRRASWPPSTRLPKGSRAVCAKGAPAVVLEHSTRRQAGATTLPLERGGRDESPRRRRIARWSRRKCAGSAAVR